MNETPKPAQKPEPPPLLVAVRVLTDNHENNGVLCKKGDIISIPSDQADWCEKNGYGERARPSA